MSLRTSIQRASRMIKELASWLEHDAALGGYATVDSMSAIDLEEAENRLRGLADKIGQRRADLIGNVPEPFREAAE